MERFAAEAGGVPAHTLEMDGRDRPVCVVLEHPASPFRKLDASAGGVACQGPVILLEGPPTIRLSVHINQGLSVQDSSGGVDLRPSMPFLPEQTMVPPATVGVRDSVVVPATTGPPGILS